MNTGFHTPFEWFMQMNIQNLDGSSRLLVFFTPFLVFSSLLPDLSRLLGALVSFRRKVMKLQENFSSVFHDKNKNIVTLKNGKPL